MTTTAPPVTGTDDVLAVLGITDGYAVMLGFGSGQCVCGGHPELVEASDRVACKVMPIAAGCCPNACGWSVVEPVTLTITGNVVAHYAAVYRAGEQVLMLRTPTAGIMGDEFDILPHP